MNNPIRKPAHADATTASLSLFAAKLESMDQRQQADMKTVNSRFDQVDSRLNALESGQARIETKVDRIEDLLAKLLDGQAILHQNDMELKRRMDRA
jgi:hypothetical protein